MGFTEEEAIAKAAEEETIRATFRAATRNTEPVKISQAPRARHRQRGRNLQRLHHRRQRRDLGPLLPPEGIWLLTYRTDTRHTPEEHLQ